jgi:predicted outer membrane protein
MRALRFAACLLAISAFAPVVVSQENTQGSKQGAQGAGERIDDAKFVMRASESDMAEISMAKLAEQNAASPAVKEFAKHMIDDHTKASSELKQIVGKSNHKLASDVSEHHKQMAEKLKSLKGQEFDREYMMGQLKAHKAAVQLFQSEIQNGQDQSIKGFAQKTLPVIQSHHQMAMQIAGKIGIQGAGQPQGQGGLIQPNQPNQPQVQPKQPIRPNQQ